MAKTPKPKEMQADAVLDATAPVAGAEPVDPAGWKLRVRALQPSRWRAGRRFGPEPVEIDAGDLTDAEKVALMQDTLLAVDVIAPDGKVTDPASGD